MGCAIAASATAWRADHEGALQTVNGFQFCGHVGKLVNRKRDEVHEHEFNHRTLACDCGADRYAGDRLFGDGRVAHTRRAEALQEAACHTKGAAISADIFAHEKDRGVALHLCRKRLPDSLCEGDAHDSASAR